jgi:hypothetical protein
MKNIRRDQQFFNVAFIGTILLIFVFSFSFTNKLNPLGNK